jgi:archaellum component FlaF (FlaF/FlaG flagellin family)
MKQSDRITINPGTALSVLGGLLAMFLVSLLSCGISGVPASHIIEKINNGEHVYYKDITIRGDLDFTSVSGKGNVVNTEVTFIDCTFKGKVTAKNTVFKKNVTFTGSIIEDTHRTLGGELRGDVNFSGAQFTGTATFAGTKFTYAVFRSKFLSGVSFKNAQFKSYADFYGAQFSNYADFEGTTFLNGVGFENATLNGEPFQVQVQETRGQAGMLGPGWYKKMLQASQNQEIKLKIYKSLKLFSIPLKKV